GPSVNRKPLDTSCIWASGATRSAAWLPVRGSRGNAASRKKEQVWRANVTDMDKLLCGLGKSRFLLLWEARITCFCVDCGKSCYSLCYSLPLSAPVPIQYNALH